jgi:hypothetical protein
MDKHMKNETITADNGIKITFLAKSMVCKKSQPIVPSASNRNRMGQTKREMAARIDYTFRSVFESDEVVDESYRLLNEMKRIERYILGKTLSPDTRDIIKKIEWTPAMARLKSVRRSQNGKGKDAQLMEYLKRLKE